VRTPLRFGGHVGGPSAAAPESVVIAFNGREFGWVMPARHEGDLEPGPTVTTLVSPDAEEEWRLAMTAVQRFLSALAFAYDLRLDSRARAGGSGEPDLLHPYGAVEARDTYGIRIAPAPGPVTVPDDDRLRLALAVYREGLNAASPFYGFLSFWNVIDAVFAGRASERNGFLNAAGPESRWWPAGVTDVAGHLWGNSRNAVAHVVRSDPANTSIDPDLPPDRERLDDEARWLQDLARLAIMTKWPTPVEVGLRAMDE
jgi:hypothetical protein